MNSLIIDMAQFKAIKTRGSFQLRYGEHVLHGRLDREALSFELAGSRCDLETTPANYGGSRYWFLCPECGERKRVLLYQNDYLGCRGCLDIPYPSLNRTKTDPQYYWNQAYKIAKRVDSSFEWIRGIQGMGYFPDRPKRMSLKKYRKNLIKFGEYTDKGNSRWMSSIRGYRKG